MKLFTVIVAFLSIGFLTGIANAQTTFYQGNQPLSQINNTGPTPNLVITEINYNGPESGSDTTEFIEIYNNDTAMVNLSGYHFVQGFVYTFPSINLDTNSYLVLAVDSAKFFNTYGVTAYEWTSGGLSNGGEDIILVTNLGDTVDIVNYDDSSPWPTSPDGNGPSLTLCNPNLDNDNGANWSAATTFVTVNSAGDSIWANPGLGCGTIVTPPAGDTIAPIVINASAVNATNINVYFSEAVDTTAENVSNYTGLGTVSSAVRNSAFDMVTLTLANSLVSGTNYTLTINNVKDTSGNTMDSAQSFSLTYNSFKVLLVDDDNYGSDESSTISTAVTNAGVSVTTFNIGSGSAPIYDTLIKYDLVIWTTANDGTSLRLWDVSDTTANGDGAVKYNAALTQYLDSNGTVWVDGLDFLYDIYGGAPRNFTAGDFAYNQMGINKYAAQSHLNDGGSGVSMAVKTASNTSMTLDTLRWKFNTLYYADALDITATAKPLYEMGPSTYPLAGKKMAHYYGNNIISTLRIGDLGNGSTSVQADIDQLVADVISMVQNGLTPKTGDIVAPIVTSAMATSLNSVEVNFSEAMSATAMDTLHYTGLSSISSISMNTANTQATLTLANSLTAGQSYNLAIEDVEDASGNIMDSAQTFAISYTIPIIPNLVITEINYNAPGSDTTEFIEIFNNDTAMVNLAGYHFVQGVTYTFPSVNIDTNSYVLVSIDSLAFFNTFGITSYQWTSGGLSNGGEDIILVTDQGDTVDVVDYDDSNPWPTSADGNGPSLSLCNPNMDNNNGANWSASITFATVNADGDSIWANPGTGCGTIVPPPPANDTIAPIVNNAMIMDSNTVSVYFSEAVDTTAENVSNYTGLGTVSSAVRNSAYDMVTLTLANSLVSGTNYTLTINNVKDTSNNIMDSAQSFTLYYNSFKVMLVDDDGNGTDESAAIVTAITNAGVSLTTFNIGSGSAPTYDTLSQFDMVLWTTANDGVGLNLWDVSDTTANGDGAIKYNAALTQYLDSNGIVWIDGLDFLYDIYGSAPRNFTAGDFAYDQMGINKYAAQSKADDGGTGVSMAIKTAGNTSMTLDTLRWKYSTLWYGDALDITATATPLYEMGPSTYTFAGKKLAHYYGNNIISTMRIATMGNGNGLVQAKLDQLVADMISMVQTGLTPKTGDLVAPFVDSVMATSPTTVDVSYSEAMNSTAMETLNYTGLGSITSVSMNTANTQATLTLATALTSGQSYNLAIEDVEDASGNIMDSAQIFTISYTFNDTIAPIVNSANALNDTTITVAFSEAVDTTAENVSNYTGLGTISSAVRNSAFDMVTLTLANSLVSGTNYTLTINNVKDASGNVMDSAQSFNISYTIPTIPNLVITEINYNGPESGSDTTEFIEIYNNDNAMVNLANYSFVQGVVYTFPSIDLDTNSYLLIAVDSVKFFNTYGVIAYQWTSGGLSNGGEDIILVNSIGDTVDIVDYDDSSPWPTSPDGNGPSLTLCNPNVDNNNGANWSAATTFVTVNASGDSLWANPGQGCGNIVPPPSSDTIPPVVNNTEINSATSVSVFFSEPVGVSAETTSNYTGLGTVSSAIRNANGDMVTLSISTALVDGASYTLTVANVKDTADNIMAAPQQFELIYNGSIADLLITEIMYNDLSSSDSLEYFEIYNNGSSTVNIGGMKVTEGIEYTFPANTMMNAGDYLVIAKESALVNSVFGISGTLQWTSGGLKNSGEDIAIENSVGDTMAYVDYDDSNPWPVAADGDGPSMEFCDKTLDNNDGNNWTLSEKMAGIFMGDTIYGTPGADCYHDAINTSTNSNININIYPNPVKDILYISSDLATYEMSIYDVSGSLIMKRQISGSNNTVNVKSLNAGLYYMQFINAKTADRVTKKLIVQ